MRERTSLPSGLVGCIRMLDVNNMVYNLQEKGGDVMYGTAVGECGNNPCQPDPCRNGAACQVREAEMFHCKCINGFSGGTDLSPFTFGSDIQIIPCPYQCLS